MVSSYLGLIWNAAAPVGTRAAGTMLAFHFLALAPPRPMTTIAAHTIRKLTRGLKGRFFSPSAPMGPKSEVVLRREFLPLGYWDPLSTLIPKI